nr:immunoglobulin heavy chain junction region [Macaca mulatta]
CSREGIFSNWGVRAWRFDVW